MFIQLKHAKYVVQYLQCGVFGAAVLLPFTFFLPVLTLFN